MRKFKKEIDMSKTKLLFISFFLVNLVATAQKTKKKEVPEDSKTSVKVKGISAPPAPPAQRKALRRAKKNPALQQVSKMPSPNIRTAKPERRPFSQVQPPPQLRKLEKPGKKISLRQKVAKEPRRRKDRIEPIKGKKKGERIRPIEKQIIPTEKRMQQKRRLVATRYPERAGVIDKAQQQELFKQLAVANVNQFAKKQIAANPQLATEIKQTETRWHTSTSVQKRWNNDWSRYSYYHDHHYFHFDTFIHFVFFAPWYLFPFSFYPDFYYHYPVYWVSVSWFRYPIYWNYGYAQEIALVSYLKQQKFDTAIDQLERRLDELENMALEMKTGSIDEEAIRSLKIQISEVIWLLNDLKRIIEERRSPISRHRKRELRDRINDLKVSGHQLMDSIA